MRKLSAAVVAVGLTLSAPHSPVLAADAAHAADGPVYVDPSATDDDFPFQGEYRGWQRSRAGSRGSTPIGLQVVARGDGKFVGVKYIGGLPGAGWNGDFSERYLLEGKRTESFVELEGELSSIVIADGRGDVYSPEGHRTGELHRVSRVSPTLGAAPPPDAVVLFDGRDTSLLVNAKTTPEGLLLPGTETAAAYGSFRLHAEFRLPYKPFALEQARGNSGVYLQSRYEVQVLDSFGLPGLANDCGAIYTLRAPDLNMCFPPLAWQTYDIDFRAARMNDEGRKIADARISIWHNGFPIHHDVNIAGKTGFGQPEGPQPLPTKLQDHRNPVVFHNVWLIETDGSPRGEWLVRLPAPPPAPIAGR